MKRILATILTSVMLVSSTLAVCAAEPATGSNSITAEDIQKLVEAIEALQKSNENLQQSNMNLQQSNLNLQESNLNLRESNLNLRESNQDLMNSNQDLVNSNDALISSNAALQSSVERLTSAINGKPAPSGGGSGGGSGKVSSSGGSSNSAYYNGSVIYPVRKIEINGVKSNATFMVAQPDGGTVTSAKNLAASVGGNLINTVTTSSPGVNFATARVNFFVGGVTDNDNIAVYQLQNGKWVQLTVSEIRKDHVIVNMTRHGVLAFIRVPALASTN
ncbi:cell division protein ZapB [Butyrivibrio sp. XPD2006]|uniref:cell division protein ZapB n=1 Tax=Butyrivibrio sp. XPD2006 TaxID=1280668 RepID=UPI0003B3C6D7|nr:cell division protein ZapB [Butyrivibrio sp. XPD2006]